MKLIICIVQNDDAKKLIKGLTRQGISVTRVSTTGGFLHGGNATLLIGIPTERLQEALDVIRDYSSTRKEYMVVPSALPGYTEAAPTPVQITLGGATVFVMDVEANYKF